MKSYCSAVSDSMILLLNSLPIHCVNHKHKQNESRYMFEDMCLCRLCGFKVIIIPLRNYLIISQPLA